MERPKAGAASRAVRLSCLDRSRVAFDLRRSFRSILVARSRAFIAPWAHRPQVREEGRRGAAMRRTPFRPAGDGEADARSTDRRQSSGLGTAIAQQPHALSRAPFAPTPGRAAAAQCCGFCERLAPAAGRSTNWLAIWHLMQKSYLNSQNAKANAVTKSALFRVSPIQDNGRKFSCRAMDNTEKIKPQSHEAPTTRIAAYRLNQPRSPVGLDTQMQQAATAPTSGTMMDAVLKPGPRRVRAGRKARICHCQQSESMTAGQSSPEFIKVASRRSLHSVATPSTLHSLI